MGNCASYSHSHRAIKQVGQPQKREQDKDQGLGYSSTSNSDHTNSMNSRASQSHSAAGVSRYHSHSSQSNTSNTQRHTKRQVPNAESNLSGVIGDASSSTASAAASTSPPPPPLPLHPTTLKRHSKNSPPVPPAPLTISTKTVNNGTPSMTRSTPQPSQQQQQQHFQQQRQAYGSLPRSSSRRGERQKSNKTPRPNSSAAHVAERLISSAQQQSMQMEMDMEEAVSGGSSGSGGCVLGGVGDGKGEPDADFRARVQDLQRDICGRGTEQRRYMQMHRQYSEAYEAQCSSPYPRIVVGSLGFKKEGRDDILQMQVFDVLQVEERPVSR